MIFLPSYIISYYSHNYNGEWKIKILYQWPISMFLDKEVNFDQKLWDTLSELHPPKKIKNDFENL